jgi:hypothetical protein
MSDAQLGLNKRLRQLEPPETSSFPDLLPAPEQGAPALDTLTNYALIDCARLLSVAVASCVAPDNVPGAAAESTLMLKTVLERRPTCSYSMMRADGGCCFSYDLYASIPPGARRRSAHVSGLRSRFSAHAAPDCSQPVLACAQATARNLRAEVLSLLAGSTAAATLAMGKACERPLLHFVHAAFVCVCVCNASGHCKCIALACYCMGQHAIGRKRFVV